MSPLSDADVRLAAQIDRALAEQTPLRAPADLEVRVFATIERRASRPWWRRSVREWPLPARAGFAAAGCAVVTALLLAPPDATPGVTLSTNLSNSIAHHAHLYQSVVDTTATFSRAMTALTDAIPAPVLRNGLALGALAYLALFGLLAAAFRTAQAFSKQPLSKDRS